MYKVSGMLIFFTMILVSIYQMGETLVTKTSLGHTEVLGLHHANTPTVFCSRYFLVSFEDVDICIKLGSISTKFQVQLLCAQIPKVKRQSTHFWDLQLLKQHVNTLMKLTPVIYSMSCYYIYLSRYFDVHAFEHD